MEIKIKNQNEMIEMAAYFIEAKEYMVMTDFERYCTSRDLIEKWNQMTVNKIKKIRMQLELYGFNIQS
jgi:hypothetical protein